MSEHPKVPLERIEREIRKRKIQKLFQIAEKFGVIERGFTAVDYLRNSIENMGWESTAITGPKGMAKSNLMLQRGYAIYGDWDRVFEYLIMNRKMFLALLKDAIDKQERIPWVGVDDIATLFPASLYFSNRKMYSSLQSAWETLRTVINCFDWSCTRKNKVAPFILSDITGDIICYKREKDVKAHFNYARWVWMRNLKDPMKVHAKMITVCDIPFPLTPDALKLDSQLREGVYMCGGKAYTGEEYFLKHECLTGIPRETFQRYWNLRLELTREAFSSFTKLLGEEEALIEKAAAALKPLVEPKAKCPFCNMERVQKYGWEVTVRGKKRRLRCANCGKSWLEGAAS